MTTEPRTDTGRGEQGPLEAVVAAVKPHLRGWLHAGMVPLSLAAGIVLIALAPTTTARLAAAVFSVTACPMNATASVSAFATSLMEFAYHPASLDVDLGENTSSRSGVRKTCAP